MKKVAVGVFEANCLAIVDEVQTKRETVVITKRGRPLAKLVPVEEHRDDLDDLFDSFRGRVTIVGDVVSPAFSSPKTDEAPPKPRLRASKH